MQQLADIFLEPKKVFDQQWEKPTFVLPLVIMMVLSAAMTFAYFNLVDASWYMDHTLAASGTDLSAADMARVRQSMPGARTMGMIGAPMAAATVAIIMAFYGLYFVLAAKIAGQQISFRRAMSLISWASMPAVLGVLVTTVAILNMAPQTSLESLMLTNVDPLFVQLPMDSAWSKLAKGFNLLNLWVWFLLALGWKTWGKTSWRQAILVALLPSLVIYGVMAAFALAK